MDPRPLIYALASCYHEAGHAVAFWHYGVRLCHVTMNPPPDSGHWGQTVTATRLKPVGLAQIEADMQCAAAGDIAQNRLVWPREELTEERLIRIFRRDAERVAEDPDFLVNDGLIFAKGGLARDDEIRNTNPGGAIGPESWLPVFREAERLIRGELWPAVQAVAEELCRSTVDLGHEDVTALAIAALNRSEA